MTDNFKGETTKISIHGFTYEVHKNALKNLITHNIKQFDDIHSYSLEQEVSEHVAYTIVREIYDNFSGKYFLTDTPSNQLYYYLFCDKYLDTSKIKMPKFTRKMQLENALDAIVNLVSGKGCTDKNVPVITNIMEPVFKKLGLTLISMRADDNSKIAHNNNIYVSFHSYHEVINLILYHAYLLGIDIYSEYVKYYKITNDEILYYNLDIDNAPRYRDNEFTKISGLEMN